MQKCFIHVKYGNTSAYARSLVQKRNILGLHLQNQQYFRKKMRNLLMQTVQLTINLRNLILRKRTKFALINSALIYAALIYSCINLFP